SDLEPTEIRNGEELVRGVRHLAQRGVLLDDDAVEGRRDGELAALAVPRTENAKPFPGALHRRLRAPQFRLGVEQLLPARDALCLEAFLPLVVLLRDLEEGGRLV